MKRKIFSKLLMGALLVASVSSFTSCKDYDDDINSLKESVAKAALQSNLDALTTQVNGIKTTAEAAATKVDLEAVKKDAAKGLEDAAKGIAAAADAQKAADAANALAQKAQEAADAIDLTAYAKKDEVESMAALATQEITAIKSQIATFLTADQIEAQLAALKQEVADANEEQMTEMKTKVDNAVEGIKSIWGAVTGVSLIAQNNGYVNGNTLAFGKVMTQKNTWPAKDVADNQYVFKAGEFYTGTDDVVVRVEPSTAVLTVDNVKLINSLGEEVSSDIVKVKAVNPVDWTFTRAAGNNGLWTVTFELNKDYDSKKFDVVAGTSKGNPQIGKSVLFAVAVNNTSTVEGAQNRRAISSYDLTMRTFNYTKAELNGTTVNGVIAGKSSTWIYANDGWKELSNTKNRWYGDNPTTVSNGFGDANSIEHEWGNSDMTAKGNYTDARTAAVLTTATSNVNTYVDDADARNAKPVITARVGDVINIAVDCTLDGNAVPGWANHPIKGFYVTLDEAFVENGSAVSELNAWRSYEYENVGYKKNGTTAVPAKLQDGNFGSITIKNLNNVVSDEIGFRIYAINLDGTIVDPDGKAFYVKVAAGAETDATITAKITATDATDASKNFVIVPVTDEFKYSLTGDTKVTDWPHDGETWTYATTNPARPGSATSGFVVTPCDANGNALANDTKNSAVSYVKVALAGLPKTYEDGTEYTQTLKLQNGGVTVKTVTLKVTKELPGFPAGFGFKSQVVRNGNAYTAFFVGDGATAGTYDDKWGANVANAKGQYDIATTFNLGTVDPAKYEWEFSGTRDDDASKSKKVTNGSNKLVAIKKYIDNETTHAMTVLYNYGQVSVYQNSNGSWVTPAAYKVSNNEEYTVTYACWHNGATFTSNAADMEITWGNPVAYVDLGKVAYTNTYNGVAYGKSLGELAWGVYLDWHLDAAGAVKFRADGSTVDNEHLQVGTKVETVVNMPPYHVGDVTYSYYSVAKPFNLVTVVDEVTSDYQTIVKSHQEYRMYIQQVNYLTNIAAHQETVTVTLKDTYGHDVVVPFKINVKAAGM